jgi:hypothetical protein
MASLVAVFPFCWRSQLAQHMPDLNGRCSQHAIFDGPLIQINMSNLIDRTFMTDPGGLMIWL